MVARIAFDGIAIHHELFWRHGSRDMGTSITGPHPSTPISKRSPGFTKGSCMQQLYRIRRFPFAKSLENNFWLKALISQETHHLFGSRANRTFLGTQK